MDNCPRRIIKSGVPRFHFVVNLKYYIRHTASLDFIFFHSHLHAPNVFLLLLRKMSEVTPQDVQNTPARKEWHPVANS